MAKVFISYSHDNDAHCGQVCALAERLRAASHIQLAFDRFLSPKSLNVEWSRWCEQQLQLADQVLIVVTETYRRRYQREESPGVGLGASFEAKLIYDDLVNRVGINPKYRVVLLQPSDAQFIPPSLRGYDIFHLDCSEGYERLNQWLAPGEPRESFEPSSIAWPSPIARDWDLADRHDVTDLFARLLSGQSVNRALLIHAESGSGKSHLMRELKECARQSNVPCSFLDCKGCPSLTDLFQRLFLSLPETFRTAKQAGADERPYAVIRDLQSVSSPILLIFDTYEAASGDTQDWLRTRLLHYLDQAPALIVVVAGQKAPDLSDCPWSGLAHRITLKPIDDADHWHKYAVRMGIPASLEELKVLVEYSQGRPYLMRTLLATKAVRPLSGAAGA